MARKLGEILTSSHGVSEEMVNKALETQAMFGGRLGTNLIDHGVVDAELLGAALAEQHAVDEATAEMLDGASVRALRLVPNTIAAKHGIVPLNVKDKILVAAMLDPTDLVGIDELAFATNLHIKALACPEIRLRTYLERYYKIPRPNRLVQVAHDAAQGVGGGGGLGLDDLEAPPEGALGNEDGFTPGADPLATQTIAQLQSPMASLNSGLTGLGMMPDLEITELLGVDPGQAVTPGVIRKAEEEAPAEKQEKIEAAVSELKRRRSARDEAVEAARVAAVESVEDVVRVLADSLTREDIGESLIRFFSKSFPRVAAFVVQKEQALGWHAIMPDTPFEQSRKDIRSASVSLEEPSIIQGVIQTGQYYLGELPGRASDEAYAAALGGPRPTDLLILPVQLNTQVVFALHADSMDESLGEFDMRSLRAACHAAELAMEVLLLRSRIRQLADLD